MNTMLKTAIFAAALLMLGGCATKALTPRRASLPERAELLYRTDQLHDRREPLFMGE